MYKINKKQISINNTPTIYKPIFSIGSRESVLLTLCFLLPFEDSQYFGGTNSAIVKTQMIIKSN